MNPAAALRRASLSDAPILIPAVASDGSLYPIEKLDAHRRGILHLAVSVFAFAGDRLLIQRRALGKYHSGGQWANTVCTHPDWGETAEHGAVRRLREELGLEARVRPTATIEYCADVGAGLTERERVQVFRADVAADAALHPNPNEVSETQWARPAVLAAQARANPERFAPWFRIYLQRWDELNLA